MYNRINIHSLVNFLVIAIISFSFSLTAKAVPGNWGLGYPKLGETPQGNESQEFLKKYDAYYAGDPNEKVIYLTFDAGYENGCTPPILDTLKKNNVPAAFFLVGTYIRDNQELVKRMIDEGHIVANHTMRHPDMSKISTEETFLKELQSAEEVFKTATGTDMPKYYRPPHGKYSEANMQMAKNLGYKTIFWSVAYADWDVNKQPSKEAAFSKLIPRVHPGAVLLLHNTSKTNSEILDELIQKYREMGYEFKSLHELVD